MSAPHPTPEVALLHRAWFGIVLLTVILVGLMGQMVGHFSGGPVALRPMHVGFNAVVGGCHAVLLVLATWGAWRVLETSVLVMRRGMAVGFVTAAVLSAALAACPLFLGVGPWPRDGSQVTLLRHLVFAPLALRELGWLALMVGLLPLLSTGQRSLCWGVMVAVGIDLALVVHHWLDTPWAVVSRIQPSLEGWVQTALWLGASAAFLALLGRLESERSERGEAPLAGSEP